MSEPVRKGFQLIQILSFDFEIVSFGMETTNEAKLLRGVSWIPGGWKVKGCQEGRSVVA